MNTIKRLSPRQAIINFPDFDVRIFVKHRGPYCSAIRIWKLPPRSTFLSMMKSGRLIWAVYDDNAKAVHGWFYKEPNLMEALAKSVTRCRDFTELKELLIGLEGLMQGKPPSARLMHLFDDTVTE